MPSDEQIAEARRRAFEERFEGHTPGPWDFVITSTSCGRAFKINELGGVHDNHGLIACIYDDHTSLNERAHDEHQANATLIINTPQLLADRALLADYIDELTAALREVQELSYYRAEERYEEWEDILFTIQRLLAQWSEAVGA